MDRSTAHLGELHVGISHDLDVVAPGVDEVEVPIRRGHAGGLGRGHHGAAVHDQAAMALRVGCLRAAADERQELIAQVDEGHDHAALVVLVGAPQVEFQHVPVEAQSLLDLADFQGDVVQADEPGFVRVLRCSLCAP